MIKKIYTINSDFKKLTIQDMKEYAYNNNIILDSKLKKKNDIYNYIINRLNTSTQTIFISDIWNIICDYVDGDIKVKLIEELNNKKNIKLLSSNPAAIYILEKI